MAPGSVSEPVAGAQGSRVIVSVMGTDHPGIVAGISRVLAEHQVNILDISQKLTGGLFLMLVVGELTRAASPLERVRKALEEEAGRLGVSAIVQHEKLFTFMHRI